MADEVAVVLGIGVGSAAVLVDKQRALVEQLPAVWVALADGRIDVRRAQVLVDALAHRKQSFGGGLADEVVDTIAAQGLGWIAEGIGPTPLTDRITGAVIAADPAEADRRAERRKRRQNVTSVGQGDGLASLRTELADAADVAEEIEVIDALAASMRKNGDKRPLGQLRVAAHHQLVTRPWQPLPDDVAAARWQLRMRVDLADLDDLGPLLDRPEDRVAARPAQGIPAPDNPADADDSPLPKPGSAPDQARPDPLASGGPPEPTGACADADPVRGADLPEDTELTNGTDLPERTNLPDGTALSEGIDLADGTDLSGGTDLSAGTELADDTDLPDVTQLTHDTDLRDATRSSGGSGVGSIGGLAVSPVAVAELLARYETLLITGPNGRIQGGEVWFEIIDTTGRLRTITSPAQARAALGRGTGLGPPPAVDRYSPSAEQVRFVKARDRHCRFPGCARPAEYVDLDHVIAHDDDNPTAGGPTCVSNLVCLCRRHHRLKTHAPGWHFAMDPDGTLHVTPPGGRTRTTKPACIAEVDMSTRGHLDTLTDLLGPTPKRYCTPTPEQRAARRAADAARARLAAEIEAEVDEALRRQAEGRGDARAADDTGTASCANPGAGTGVTSSAADEDPPAV